MVNRKERIKMNMISGYIDGSVSGQVIPSLISRTVSVDVKHHVYLLTGKFTYQVASKLEGTLIFGWVCRYADQQMS